MDAATFDAILVEVASGEPAYKAMQAQGSNYKAFYGHLNSDESAREKYARAKADGIDRLADEILSIADEVEPDAAATAKARLQVDSRKWLLSKLVPKKYGDKVDLTHAGDPARPIISEVRRTVIDPKNAFAEFNLAAALGQRLNSRDPDS